jgi:hypothetical protein
MPSSYTTSLRLTLPATGELGGQWGNTVNTGITELLDAAVAGTATISTWGGPGVSYTLSNNSGTADEARKMFIVATGTPGEAKNVICPAVSKMYVFRNDTTGGYALTLKTSGGTGVSVPAGQYKFLYCDGTNVVEAVNSLGPVAALSTSQAVFTDGSKNLVSNPITGTGNVVMSASPTLTGTVAGASLQLSSLTSGRVTYAGASGLLQDSTNLTFDGTALTLGGNPTLSAGTANGVLYLNGSKVATSGSALTFDGNTLAVSRNASSATIDINASDTTSTSYLRLQDFGTTRAWFASYRDGSGKTELLGNGFLQFSLGGGASPSEQMCLTSTGLGIGMSSPGYKLDVTKDANSFTGARFRNNDSGSSAYSGVVVNAFGNSWAMRMGSTAANSNALQFVQDALGTPVVRATLDTSGNVIAGGSVALATTATDGFLYVPTCAGTPTGVPTAITGMAPIVVNTTNNKLYFYSGGAWRDAGP